MNTELIIQLWLSLCIVIALYGFIEINLTKLNIRWWLLLGYTALTILGLIWFK